MHFELEARRPKLLALSLLLVLQLGFWIAFARIVRVAPVMGEIASGVALELRVLAPLIVLAPVAAKLWAWLDARGLEPSTTAKFSLGFLGLAASCTCLAASVEWPFAVGLGVVGLTLAALSVGPACVAAVWELSPAGARVPLLGCTVGSYVLARAVAGWMDVSVSRDVGFEICLALGFGCVATAVLSSCMWRGLASLASTDQVPPAPTAHSLGLGSPGAAPVSVPSLGSTSLG